MAEATLTKEEEVTQPEAEAPPSEPAEETTPAPVPEVEAPKAEVDDPYLKQVLKNRGLGDVATSEGTDATPAANESEADPYAGLSPQEIRAKLLDELKAEQLADSKLKADQNYVNGVRSSFDNRGVEVTAFANRHGLDLEAADELRALLGKHNGEVGVLAQNAHTVALEIQREGMKKALIDAATAAGVKDVSFASAPDFIAKLTEHAKTGSISEAEAKKREAIAATESMAEYRQVLIDNGVDIPGVRVPEVPNNPGNLNARVGTVEWATDAPISELIADRARRAASA